MQQLERIAHMETLLNQSAARDDALHAMQTLCTNGKAPFDASED